MPEKKWKTIVIRKKQMLFHLLLAFFIKPKHFLFLAKEAITNNNFKYLLIAIDFFIQIRKLAIAGVHVQMGDHKLFIGYYLSKLLGVKLSTTIHAHELYQPIAYKNKSLLSKVLNACMKIVTISEFNKQLLINNFGINSEKIEIMYLYPSNKAQENNIQSKKILIVASWIRKKGYEDLLMALSEIKKVRNDFSLWVVGTDIKTQDESVNVKELVDKYELSKNVILLGSQPNPVMNILFEYCDMFCLPSITDYYPNGNVREREGIPVALMEAMSWGKPVITTKHAGIPELVREFLIDEKDVKSLEKTITFLLDNPVQCQESGLINHKIVHSKFNTDNVQVLIKVFNSYIS